MVIVLLLMFVLYIYVLIAWWYYEFDKDRKEQERWLAKWCVYTLIAYTLIVIVIIGDRLW